ncbi:hypothetical protein BN1723_011163 [Verticillium longisporum]|uniref:Cation-transporting P-type ATPase N-terminal domain-containing protein n=1 Tax=Verticillium longisporum TaxID=100787 RepID=A0A0G4L4S0_VERLO|nr:hypothetical protein BN1723_011163 [Verticillium longisporum]
MQWPWRGDGDDQGSLKKNDSLLPTSNYTPKITGASHDGGFEKEAPARPAYNRTTSAQSRSVAEQYSFMTPAEIASRLQTSLTHGLAPASASGRLHDYGPNEIPHDPPEPLWLRFVKQFQEPLIVLLLVSAGASIFLGNTDDAVSITVAVTIVVTVGFVQEYRSEKSIEALSGLVPNHAHLIRGEQKGPSSGSWPAVSTNAKVEGAPTDTATAIEEALEVASSKVMAAQLVPGDLVLFTTGDRIPCLVVAIYIVPDSTSKKEFLEGILGLISGSVVGIRGGVGWATGSDGGVKGCLAGFRILKTRLARGVEQGLEVGGIVGPGVMEDKLDVFGARRRYTGGEGVVDDGRGRGRRGRVSCHAEFSNRYRTAR